MKYLLSLLLCLAVVVPLGAADVQNVTPKASFSTSAKAGNAVILGPTEVKAGATAFLKLSESAEWVDWKMLPEKSDASFMAFQSYLGMSPDGKPIIQHIGIFSSMVPGTYYFSVAASGQIHVVHTIVVTGDKPNPDPSPDPEPDPDPSPDPSPFPLPPSKMFVLILGETGDRTAQQAAAMLQAREYLESKSISYRIEDPNLPGKDGKPVQWLQPYLQTVQQDNALQLPVLIIGELAAEGIVRRTVAPLPVTGAAIIETVKARIAK